MNETGSAVTKEIDHPNCFVCRLLAEHACMLINNDHNSIGSRFKHYGYILELLEPYFEDVEGLQEKMISGGVEFKLEKLRGLVKDNFTVDIKFEQRMQFDDNVEIGIVDQKNKYHWTRFEGRNLHEALDKAIDKLENPEKDYIDLTGYVWKADERSVYSKEHIETFLRRSE